jgi:hypothetical protein
LKYPGINHVIQYETVVMTVLEEDFTGHIARSGIHAENSKDFAVLMSHITYLDLSALDSRDFLAMAVFGEDSA